MCLGPLFSVCSIVEECYCFVCFRSNKNLVKFIRFGIVQSNLILGGFLPTDHSEHIYLSKLYCENCM